MHKPMYIKKKLCKKKFSVHMRIEKAYRAHIRKGLLSMQARARGPNETLFMGRQVIASACTVCVCPANIWRDLALIANFLCSFICESK